MQVRVVTLSRLREGFKSDQEAHGKGDREADIHFLVFSQAMALASQIEVRRARRRPSLKCGLGCILTVPRFYAEVPGKTITLPGTSA